MLEHDLKRIYEWPFMSQMVLLFIASIFIFYLGYVIDIERIKSNINTVKGQEKQLKGDLQSAIEATARLENNLLQFPKLKQMITDWQRNIITAKELPGTLDNLLKLGEDSHVKFNLFNPGAEVREGAYYKIPVKIEMTGSYDDIATYISHVANYNKLIVINSFNIANDTLSNPNNAGSVGNDEKQFVKILHSDNPVIVQLELEIYRL